MSNLKYIKTSLCWFVTTEKKKHFLLIFFCGIIDFCIRACRPDLCEINWKLLFGYPVIKQASN